MPEEDDGVFLQLIERVRVAGLSLPDELSAFERYMRCSSLLPKVGAPFGDFMVHEALMERGAYGLLYRVTRKKDGMPLVLKVLRPQLADPASEKVVRAFLRESDILIACAAREVQGIPMVFGRGECGQVPTRIHYYLMEELLGLSLSELVQQYTWDGELFPVARLLRLTISLCGTLAALHHL